MSSTPSPLVPLMLAALTAVGVAIGIQHIGSETKSNPPGQTQVQATIRPKWTASAQGRVEPKGGEIRLSAQTPGRIENVLVKVNDTVRAGDLLIRIDDADALARLLGADAEAGVRKRERDSETGVPRLAQDRRNAEDRLNTTERAIAVSRLELDRLMLARHASSTSIRPEQIDAQRKVLEEALKRLDEDRQALRQSQLATGVPLPTRLEAGLTASRAELSLAEAALERTRVRAPFDATVLQVIAHVGENAAASPEQPLVIVGDLAALRVRAEVEERDAAKVTVGQEVVLKTDAFAGREFKGRVATIARAMRPPTLARKGPRRPSDLDTLEVMIDVDAGSSLLPGMRVDVYFAVPQPGGTEPPKAESSSLAPPAAAPAGGPAAAAPKAQGATGVITPASAVPAAGAPQVLPPLEQPKGN
ncbi:MAG: efflux RND transporter periplasmic adaptor subunit [Hyphomicrobiaceae bacterium]|nr:efflux RND transporter periplasmic adaptor subunit [Hyphomicrobiaceae bacterium]